MLVLLIGAQRRCNLNEGSQSFNILKTGVEVEKVASCKLGKRDGTGTPTHYDHS